MLVVPAELRRTLMRGLVDHYLERRMREGAPVLQISRDFLDMTDTVENLSGQSGLDPIPHLEGNGRRQIDHRQHARVDGHDRLALSAYALLNLLVEPSQLLEALAVSA